MCMVVIETMCIEPSYTYMKTATEGFKSVRHEVGTMTTFADSLLDVSCNTSDNNSTVSNITNSVNTTPVVEGLATIKKDSSVATTKKFYGVAHSMDDLIKEFAGKEIAFSVKKTGNLVPVGKIPQMLYEHLSCEAHNYFTYIPHGSWGVRYVKKERVGGLKQILTKIGMKVSILEANY